MSQQNTYAPWWTTMFDKWLSRSSKRPSDCYRAAQKAFDAGRYQSCIDMIDRALDLESPHLSDPSFSKTAAFRCRSYAYRELGRNARAAADLQRVLELEPGLMTNYLDLAEMQVSAGWPTEALATVNKGIAHFDHRQAAELYMQRGRLAAREGAYQNAIDDLNFAVYYLPRSAEARAERGLLYADLKNFRKAIDDCRKAVSIHPDSAAALYAYGRVLFLSGQYDKAYTQLAKAIVEDPEHAEAASLFGRCLIHLEAYDKALPVLKKAVELGAVDPMTIQVLEDLEELFEDTTEDPRALSSGATTLLPGPTADHRRFATQIKVYDQVDEPPLFPYGNEVEEDRFWAAEQALQLYIYQSLDYPVEAQLVGVSGVVNLEFIVERDGHLTEPRVKSRLGFGCEEAAVAVIQQMIVDNIRWEPGKIKDVPVRTRYLLAVKF